MESSAKATKIQLFSLATPQMRAFHMSWFAFFLCFFAWFGIAPLITIVEEELALKPYQLKWCIIGSVALTVFARLFIGWLCDRIGPRLSYTILLVVGAIPVMGIGLSNSFATFLMFRVFIGIIGASFVITQYHTSVMFAPNVVGTANATTAGWGNLGGGVTQFVMPALFALLVGTFAFSDAVSWRVCMLIAGFVCMLTGVAYYYFTQDCPEGNYKDLRAAGKMPEGKTTNGTFLMACADYRVWALFLIYGACFGIELTMNNILARYFLKNFTYFQDMYENPATKNTALKIAGLAAASFGLMNIFARTLGGWISDKIAKNSGLKGRVFWLFVALFVEGLALILFSQMGILVVAIPALILFSLFVQMSEGATYSVVPFVNKKALGSVAGIVGAGGNAGAVAAGFLFGMEDWSTALLILGLVVTGCSFLAAFVRFPVEQEAPIPSEEPIVSGPAVPETAIVAAD